MSKRTNLRGMGLKVGKEPEQIIEYYKKKVGAKNYKALQQFYKMKANKIIHVRMYKVLHTIIQFFDTVKFKDYDKVTHNETFYWEKFLKQYKNATQNSYNTIVKSFYNAIYDLEDQKPPKCIRDLMTSREEDILGVKDVITYSDKDFLVSKAKTPRDRAILSILHEWGVRSKELLTQNVGDFRKENGAWWMHIPKGKKTSFARDVPLFDSVQAITTYLNNHPNKDDPDAPMWITERVLHGERGRFQKGALDKMLKDLQRDSGFQKNIRPHVWRHSSASLKASRLEFPVFCETHGWAGNSKHAKRYIHISKASKLTAIQKMHGLKTEEQEEEKTVIQCACGFINPKTNKFCGGCSNALTMDVALELKRAKQAVALAQALSIRMKTPQKEEALMNMIQRKIIKNLKEKGLV